MKTIEEMKAAAVAECDKLFKIAMELEADEDVISPIVKLHGSVSIQSGFLMRDGTHHECVFLRIGLFTAAYLWSECSDADTDLFYRILGLESRDAVEAYKASLQSDLKSMTAIVASVKKGEQPDYVHISKITELQDRNTALVEALEEIRKPAMIISLGKATNRDRAEQLTEDHKRVRMIAQSALTTNTEKGGVNGEV